MKHLESVSSEYLPNSAEANENDLILHWYPKRIVDRLFHCQGPLKLGLGDGFTQTIFNVACDAHTIIEASQVVINLFRERHTEFSAELVFTYFEDQEPVEFFDVIVMGLILEHVDDPALVLRRYKNFLKPGGRLFIAVRNAKSMNRRLGFELGKVKDIYDLNANDLALGHKRKFCRDTLKNMVVDCGYQATYEEGIYLKPLPLGMLQTLPDLQENLHAMLKVGIEFSDLCVGLLMKAAPA